MTTARNKSPSHGVVLREDTAPHSAKPVPRGKESRKGKGVEIRLKSKTWKTIAPIQSATWKSKAFEAGTWGGEVRSDFAVDLPLHSLFTYPTVASLAAEIVRMMGDSEHEDTARLVAELEAMSDEEAERLLAGDLAPPEGELHP